MQSVEAKRCPGWCTIVVLGTAILIYHVEGNVKYQMLTNLLFQEVESGAFEAVCSSIALAECLVHPFRRGDATLATQFRERITMGENTLYVGVDPIVEQAAELRARYNLGLADALQVAAAIAAQCDLFVTNDKRLKRVNELTVVVLDELTT